MGNRPDNWESMSQEERQTWLREEQDRKYPPGKKCTSCGEEGYPTSFSNCAEKKKMDEAEVCFTCAFWLNKIDMVKASKGRITIIEGGWYSPGNGLPPERFLGMAGRRFDIEYLADEHRITTFDLWSGGKIPEHFKEQLPDTAKFLNGAERADFPKGSLYEAAWNPSDGKTECYPMPNGRAVPLANDRAKRERLAAEKQKEV